MKKISLLFTVFVFLTSISGISQTTEKQVKTTGVFDVNVTQFKKLVDSKKGLILDVRTPEEWAEGTIANAQKINYYDKDFADKVEHLDKNTPVLIYCKRGEGVKVQLKFLKKKAL